MALADFDNMVPSAKDFFTRSNVLLITGATGFLGKVLLEKTLRTYPQITKVYLMIRSKDGMSARDRLHSQILESPAFDGLRERCGGSEGFEQLIISKLVPISCDLEEYDFGLDSKDRMKLQRDTTVIFHCAAINRLGSSLGSILKMNVQAPLRLAELALTMSQLRSFVHVSSCYVNSFQSGLVFEKSYPHPFGNVERLWRVLKKMSPTELRRYDQSTIPSMFPNLMSFSKSLVEKLFESRFENSMLPLMIIRPSNISAAVSEPIAGWVEGIESGMNQLILASALGSSSSSHQEPSKSTAQKLLKKLNHHAVLDLIPVDIVVKIMLQAAVYTNTTPGEDRFPVFHASTSMMTRPMTLKIFSDFADQFWFSEDSQVLENNVNNNDNNCRDDQDFTRRRQQQQVEILEHHKQELIHLDRQVFEAQLNHDLNRISTDRLLILPGTTHQPRLQAVPIDDSLFISSDHGNVTGRKNLDNRFLIRDWVFDMTKSQRLNQQSSPELQYRLNGTWDWFGYLADLNLGVQEFVIKILLDTAIGDDVLHMALVGLEDPPIEERSISRSRTSGAELANIDFFTSYIPAMLSRL